MVISTRPLIELVPVQPAAMTGRQLCQWDKDSCSDAGFLKIDLLGLGMLSAVEDCVEQIAEVYGEPIDLSRIPLDDRAVYAEIQKADTIGDFQIESRAQMQSLLRTKPENLDDLTVQVALVRPGPIQGKAVHPYIDARERLRVDPDYVPPVDHELLREPLRDTHGVVVFQDQVLDVAMALAGFTIGEAEGLRRAMSRKRSEEAIEAFRERFIEGAARNGVDARDRGQGLRQARGLLRLRLPEVARGRVRAARLPVGLAAPPLSGRVPLLAPERAADGLLPALDRSCATPRGEAWRCARRTSTSARSRCTWEESAVRMGLKYVKSVGEDDAEALVAEREANGEFVDVGDLARRAPLDARELEALLRSGACDRWGKRRDLLWELGLVTRPQTVQRENTQLALELDPTAATPELPDLTAWERMLADYATTSVSIDVHPLTLLRPHLPPGVLPSDGLNEAPHRSRVAFAGMAVARQRPSTAQRDRLHAARGRARPGEPDRLAGALRAEPCDRPWRAAAARPRPLRADQGQPEHRRRVAREPRPARAVDREQRRRRVPAVRAPLRA